MLNTTDLKNGIAFEYYGTPYKVLNYEHIKMSRGGATVKVKCVDLISGAIKELGFSSNEKVKEADVENINMQYLYKDQENLYFMNDVDFNQYELPLKGNEYETKYLMEGKNFQIMVYKNKPISIILPPSMFYKVIEAPDAVKGNTSTNPSKRITLENGLEMNAPLFIKIGDTIKVNTTTGEYTGRGY